MTEMPNFRSRPRSTVATWPRARRPEPTRDVLALLAAPVLGLARAYARWRRRERAIAELARLDDATLADMGLHRGEIRSAVIEAQRPGWPAERRRCR